MSANRVPARTASTRSAGACSTMPDNSVVSTTSCGSAPSPPQLDFVPAPETLTTLVVARRASASSSTVCGRARTAVRGSEDIGDAGLLQRMDTCTTSRTLPAQARRRKDLAGVAQRLRVERAAQELHDVEVVGGEHATHLPLLVMTDAVFAGDGAAVLEAQLEDARGHRFGLFRLAARLVEQHERMQVALTGMEDVGDADARRCAQLGDVAQDLRQCRPRDHTVLHDVVPADPADRGERRLAATPDLHPFRVVDGQPHLERAGRLTVALDESEVRLDLRLGPVQLDDEDRTRADWIATAHRGFRCLDGERVHHLDRRR